MSRPPTRGPKKLDRDALWDYALRTLGSRALSTGEMRTRLLRRAESERDIADILARLKELGYLNDKRFAECFALARKENQGLGRMRVVRDLRARRVAPELAGKAADQAYEGSNETELIEAFLKRKFRGVDLADTLKIESKLASAFRKLRYAGFSAANSIRVLKSYSQRAAELEDLDADGE
jgi:regulatory protein